MDTTVPVNCFYLRFFLVQKNDLNVFFVTFQKFLKRKKIRILNKKDILDPFAIIVKLLKSSWQYVLPHPSRCLALGLWRAVAVAAQRSQLPPGRLLSV